jgi:hypothetical protein
LSHSSSPWEQNPKPESSSIPGDRPQEHVRTEFQNCSGPVIAACSLFHVSERQYLVWFSYPCH